MWLEARNLQTTHPSAKLAPRRYGPFLVTSAVSRTSYRLKLPNTWKIHNVFHASLLTPYKETSTNGNRMREPAPDLVNGQPEWEVDQILGARKRRNQLQYLVRWKGFSEAHDSWEPLTHINADERIKAYYQQHPRAIRSAYKNHAKPPTITIRRIMTSNTPSPTGYSLSPSYTPTLSPQALPIPPPLTPPNAPPSPEMPSPEYHTPDSQPDPTAIPIASLAQMTPLPASPVPSRPPGLSATTTSLLARIRAPHDTIALLERMTSPPGLGVGTPPIPPPSPSIYHSSSGDERTEPMRRIRDPPENYVVLNHRFPNHRLYAEKVRLPNGLWRYPHYIRFSHDYNTHQHYVLGKCSGDDPNVSPYGWPLYAAPFTGPLPPAPVEDTDLSIFNPDTTMSLAVDIALHGLDDRGIVGDVDHFRDLATQHKALKEEQHKLDNKFAEWRHKWGPVRSRLIHSRAHTRLHPYMDKLSHEHVIPLPGDDRPYREGNLTPLEAYTAYHGESPPRWLPLPWYWEERSSPEQRKDWCTYCHSHYHSLNNCPNPHRYCTNRLSCNVPSTHTFYLGGCPYALEHIHDDESDRVSIEGDVDPNPYDLDGES